MENIKIVFPFYLGKQENVNVLILLWYFENLKSTQLSISAIYFYPNLMLTTKDRTTTGSVVFLLFYGNGDLK